MYIIQKKLENFIKKGKFMILLNYQNFFMKLKINNKLIINFKSY